MSEPEDSREPELGSERDESLIRALPGLARITAAAWWRTLGWTADTSWRTSTRVLRAAASGEPPADVLRDAGEDVRDYARRLIGLMDEEDDHEERAEDAISGRDGSATREGLRARGAELLALSADVSYEEDTHPAYARILDQLTPDEARILRLLATGGPQPAVDVRTGGPLTISSDLVAPGLTMIGDEAGCRHLDRVPSYLNNLYRLGLIWFSREELEELSRYQVLEAQPEVAEAIEMAGRGAKTVRRSIHLTHFGDDFCSVCLPLEDRSTGP
jgi:Abortive infection alpha